VTEGQTSVLIPIVAGEAAVSVAAARARAHEVNAAQLAALTPDLMPASEHDEVITPAGVPINIRILRPAASGPRPTIVYFHGGGWIIGGLDIHLGQARRLCVLAGAVVVSVDHRPAPEHRFPAAFDDASAATDWIGARLDEFGGSDVLIVAGDGSGGQLAASVALARRDAGLPLAAQLLFHPVTDVAGRYADPEINSFYMSRWDSKKRSTLTLDALASFAAAYVDGPDAADWRVSPKRAGALAGLAPAVIHTSTIDVLRTEGNFYADDLRAAGVRVISREFPSLNHSYFAWSGVSAVADAAAAEAVEDLQQLLGA
jgi:acetyl esterase